jgi:hypothetical protein
MNSWRDIKVGIMFLAAAILLIALALSKILVRVVGNDIAARAIIVTLTVALIVLVMREIKHLVERT